MNGAINIREAKADDRKAIHAVEAAAFGQPDEADLVDRLVAAGDVVLELVAVEGEAIVGHILFSRLMVEDGAGRPAVALAPLAVAPDRQRQGIGMALMTEAHHLLRERGETLAVVLGDPAYYARAGYRHERAAGFSSDYQCDALQALAWGEAPTSGRLVYAPAFSGS